MLNLIKLQNFTYKIYVELIGSKCICSCLDSQLTIWAIFRAKKRQNLHVCAFLVWGFLNRSLKYIKTFWLPTNIVIILQYGVNIKPVPVSYRIKQAFLSVQRFVLPSSIRSLHHAGMIKQKDAPTENHLIQWDVRGASTEGQRAQHTDNILITPKAVQKLHSPYRSIHKCINSVWTNSGNTRYKKRDEELPVNNQTSDVVKNMLATHRLVHMFCAVRLH